MSLTETIITTDTDVEDAEHTQAILDKAEKLQADREEGTERPDWLPEGFDTVEDFLADYNRLKDDTAEEQAEDSEQEDGTEDDDAAQDESRQDQPEGIDFEALTSEFNENGNLSDATLQALEDAGIPREVVQGHIAGLQAQAELAEIRISQRFGGEENFKAVLQWAGQALPEKEINRVNSLIEQGDFDGYILAMEGVKARYEAAYGSLATEELAGDVASAVDVYESTEQMKADMRDPRYQSDEAFRSKVAAKVARTRRLAQ